MKCSCHEIEFEADERAYLAPDDEELLCEDGWRDLLHEDVFDYDAPNYTHGYISIVRDHGRFIRAQSYPPEQIGCMTNDEIDRRLK